VPDTKINESELKVDYFSGGQVRLFGGDNPDSLRGLKLDGVVLDEYADMKPDLYREIIIPSLMDRNGWVCIIGTAQGRDAFYKVWTDALSRGDWFTLMLKASETGILEPERLAKAKLEMSPEQYNREFECSFDEPGIGQFISGAMVQAAVDRQGKPLGPRVMGVDIARFGDDRSVIVYRDGDVVVDVQVFHGQDTMQMVGHITVGIKVFRPDAIFVDVAGVGGGVVDRLTQLGYRIIDVNAGNKSSDDTKWPLLRDEMWHRMRAWIQDRGVLPNRTDIAADLTSATYKYDMRNRVKLVSKADLKAEGLPSPDLADGLAMTFAYPVAHSDMQDAPPWMRPRDRGPSEENARWGWT
jgi:hypothetical protein